MTRDAAVLLSLVLVGAGWLLVHLGLLLRLVRSRREHPLSLPLRLLAWLPPATPIVGWLVGARGLCALWTALGLAYLVLRGLA
jgi:hypothetical protein